MLDIESDISGPVLNEILGLVYKHTGITMTDKKKSLLQGRLRPRLRKLSIRTYQEYVSYFSAHPEEVQEFINLVTTNETTFFRTQRVWDYFEKEFLVNWIKSGSSKTLRIWSAASSSGEEAYSIAMVCHNFKEKNPKFSFQVNATDISTEVLKLAETGIFEGRSIEDFKSRFPDLVKKYFSPNGAGGYQAKTEIHKSVTFGIHSLFDRPKLKQGYDIVFLRNVMIYFNVEDQEKVLINIVESLAPGGILILGESESLARFKTPFHFVAPLVYRKPEGA